MDNDLKISYLTLGCKVNYYETERIREEFEKRGYVTVKWGTASDICVINTCTVTSIADRKSRKMIRSAKRSNPEAIIVATGCYIDDKKNMSDDNVSADDISDYADLMYSNADKSSLADKVDEYVHTHMANADEKKIDDKTHAHKDNGGTHKLGEGENTGRTRAFIKIQDGCNQFCTYCRIPYVRGHGKLISTRADEVIEKVKDYVKTGHKEVVLSGIHLSSYGVDIAGENDFTKLRGKPLAKLIRRICDETDVKRVRLGSLEPRVITEEFLGILADEEKFCPHFHLSLQSGSESVLSRMNRHYTPSEYKEKVTLLRDVWDRPAITTDVIVGFPGESDTEYSQTIDFLDDIKLSDIHVFPYSQRAGTKAAKMPSQISPDVKKKRTDILLEKVKGWQKAYREMFIDEEVYVLFEEWTKAYPDRALCGHTDRYLRVEVPESKAYSSGYIAGEIAPVIYKAEYVSQSRK